MYKTVVKFCNVFLRNSLRMLTMTFNFKVKKKKKVVEPTSTVNNDLIASSGNLKLNGLDQCS